MAARVSLFTKLPFSLSSRQKQWLHATLLAGVSGILYFLAFNLDTIIVLPRGAKGIIAGLCLAAISKSAGYALSQMPTQTPPAAPPTPPAPTP